MSKLLPQANNLNLVIDVFSYIYLHPACTKQDVADYCGFSLRQVDYYANACIYLDLIDQDWRPSVLAIDIFENSRAEVTERVYARIIDDDIMGLVYKKIQENPDEYPTDFAKELVREEFPGYSDAVYARRSDIIIKWCKKIYSYQTNNTGL